MVNFVVKEISNPYLYEKLSLWSILLVAAIAMGLSSCSRSSATLDYIAADADFVMSLNVRANPRKCRMRQKR